MLKLLDDELVELGLDELAELVEIELADDSLDELCELVELELLLLWLLVLAELLLLLSSLWLELDVLTLDRLELAELSELLLCELTELAELAELLVLIELTLADEELALLRDDELLWELKLAELEVPSLTSSWSH